MCSDAVISHPGSVAPKAQTLPSTRFPITANLVWYHALVDAEFGINQLRPGVVGVALAWGPARSVGGHQDPVSSILTRAKCGLQCWNTGSADGIHVEPTLPARLVLVSHPGVEVSLARVACRHACPLVMPACALGYLAKSFATCSFETPMALD